MIYTTKSIKTSKENYITMACAFVNAHQLVNTEKWSLFYMNSHFTDNNMWFKKTSIQFQSK